MNNPEAPIVFDLLTVFRQYRRAFLVVPLLLGLTALVAATLLPKKFAYNALLQAGPLPTDERRPALIDVAEVSTYTEFKFKEKSKFTEGRAALNSVSFLRSASSSVVLTVMGTSMADAESELRGIVDDIQSHYSVRIEKWLKTRESKLKAVEERLAVATTTADALRAEIRAPRDLTRALAVQTSFESINREVFRLLDERHNLELAIADEKNQMFRVSEMAPQSTRAVFPKIGQFAALGFLVGLVLVFFAGYARILFTRSEAFA